VSYWLKRGDGVLFGGNIVYNNAAGNLGGKIIVEKESGGIALADHVLPLQHATQMLSSSPFSSSLFAFSSFSSLHHSKAHGLTD
jgi:hypothetical protein